MNPWRQMCIKTRQEIKILSLCHPPEGSCPVTPRRAAGGSSDPSEGTTHSHGRNQSVPQLCLLHYTGGTQLCSHFWLPVPWTKVNVLLCIYQKHPPSSFCSNRCSGFKITQALNIGSNCHDDTAQRHWQPIILLWLSLQYLLWDSRSLKSKHTPPGQACVVSERGNMCTAGQTFPSQSGVTLAEPRRADKWCRDNRNRKFHVDAMTTNLCSSVYTWYE